MQSVLVTGGGRGIGRAIALGFAAPGRRIAIAGRQVERLERTAAEIERREASAHPLVMDVTDTRSVDRAFEELGGLVDHLDVLVNNAGVGGGEPVEGSDEARWRRTIDTNLTGMYLVTRRALRLMRRGGRIVNLSSVLGRFGVAGYTAYCASKHGVIGFTRALALEMADRGITVNAMCPGWVDTEMSEQGMRQGAAAQGLSFEAFRHAALDAVPIRRFVELEEVAALCRFLASPEAAAITGQTFNVCGGQTMD